MSIHLSKNHIFKELTSNWIIFSTFHQYLSFT